MERGERAYEVPRARKIVAKSVGRMVRGERARAGGMMTMERSVCGGGRVHVQRLGWRGICLREKRDGRRDGVERECLGRGGTYVRW